MDLMPFMDILTQDILQSVLRSGCSSHVRRLDTASKTPPPLLLSNT